MNKSPRIGLLGIMQELYDDMIPGITEHQAQYARGVAERLSEVAQVVFTRPARNREDRRWIAWTLVPTNRTFFNWKSSGRAPEVMMRMSPEPRPRAQWRKGSSWCFSKTMPRVS